MRPRLRRPLLAVAVLAAACTKGTEASAPSRSPISRLCVGPAGFGFDPRAPIALSPVPRAPTAWWSDAALVVFAAGCHSTSETLVGVPRLSRSGAFSWVVDGTFTTTMPSHGPVLPDCGEGHFGYRLGSLDPGHHEFSAAATSLGVNVPAPGTPLPTSSTVGEWSCIDVSAGTPTGPSIPPDEIVQRSGPNAKPPPPASVPLPPLPLPSSGSANPAPPDWCTYENGYACPAGFNCCAAGPRHPGQAAPCTLPRGDTEPGTNVCR
jgi:hypothetical protein